MGYSHTTGNNAAHAFLYSGSTMTDLGTLGGTNSFANGLNGSGQVVGSSEVLGSPDRHAFLDNGSMMTDLNSLIDPLAGWSLVDANSINDTGQIVGFGYHNAEAHAFLLTPVPEPSSIALLLALALGGLLWRRRRS